ncbi:DUF2490 domain-containing protein [Cyclobacterium sp.]|uniref:DUF2490 domain-containing protein n=1 Tax=Cyclobacterium sp. TaxID=1966343 RepID=UPI0019C2C227|nr:DUF2490 domain-containing protein [Cyclobacterium sp.]MBD3629425.1 DUF2490 domain-containing protein [Cyclobacterium sp.]
MRKIFWIILLVLPIEIMAQGRVSNFGLFPEFQIGFNATEKLKVTGKIESQHGMVDKVENSDAKYGYYHNQTDFQGFLGTSINPFVAITGGYQYRLESGSENSHRSIQQVSILQRKGNFKIGHRIRTDQTFAPNDPVEFRLRYRISYEIPIEGQSLDPGEFYLVFSDEPIYSIQSGESGLENRVVAALGHFSKGKQKFQAGIDYRTDRFFDDAFRQRTWFKFGWYLKL